MKCLPEYRTWISAVSDQGAVSLADGFGHRRGGGKCDRIVDTDDDVVAAAAAAAALLPFAGRRECSRVCLQQPPQQLDQTIALWAARWLCFSTKNDHRIIKTGSRSTDDPSEKVLVRNNDEPLTSHADHLRWPSRTLISCLTDDVAFISGRIYLGPSHLPRADAVARPS